MVIKSGKDFRSLVRFHEEILKSLKTQKMRTDKQFQRLSDNMREILNVPSNKFLDWALALEPYIETTMNSKINDLELIKHYQIYVKELIENQAQSVELINQINSRNHDYDLLANAILKLENALTEAEKDLEMYQEEEETSRQSADVLNRKIDSQKEELVDYEIIIDELQNQIENLKQEKEKVLNKLGELRSQPSPVELVEQIKNLKKERADAESKIEELQKKSDDLEFREIQALERANRLEEEEKTRKIVSEKERKEEQSRVNTKNDKEEQIKSQPGPEKNLENESSNQKSEKVASKISETDEKEIKEIPETTPEQESDEAYFAKMDKGTFRRIKKRFTEQLKKFREYREKISHVDVMKMYEVLEELEAPAKIVEIYDLSRNRGMTLGQTQMYVNFKKLKDDKIVFSCGTIKGLYSIMPFDIDNPYRLLRLIKKEEAENEAE